MSGLCLKTPPPTVYPNSITLSIFIFKPIPLESSRSEPIETKFFPLHPNPNACFCSIIGRWGRVDERGKPPK